MYRLIFCSITLFTFATNQTHGMQPTRKDRIQHTAVTLFKSISQPAYESCQKRCCHNIPTVHRKDQCGCFAAYNTAYLLDSEMHLTDHDWKNYGSHEHYHAWLASKPLSKKERSYLAHNKVRTLIDQKHKPHTTLIKPEVYEESTQEIWLPITNNLLKKIIQFRRNNLPHAIIINVHEHWLCIFLYKNRTYIVDSYNRFSYYKDVAQAIHELFRLANLDAIIHEEYFVRRIT